MKIITSAKYKQLTEEERHLYLVKYLKHCIQSSITKTHSPENFALASWPYFMAEQIGSQKAFNKLLKLVSND